MRAPDEPGDTGCEKRGRALQALTRIFPPVLPFTQIGRCSALLICAYFRDAARKCAQDNVKNSAEGLQPIAVSLVSWIEGSPYTDRTLHLPGSFLEQGACNACSAKRIPVPRRAFDQPFTQARLILRRVAPVWQAKGLHPRLLDVKSTNGHRAGGPFAMASHWPPEDVLLAVGCRCSDLGPALADCWRVVSRSGPVFQCIGAVRSRSSTYPHALPTNPRAGCMPNCGIPHFPRHFVDTLRVRSRIFQKAYFFPLKSVGQHRGPCHIRSR